MNMRTCAFDIGFKRLLALAVIVITAGSGLAGCAPAPKHDDLVQYSTIDALLAGLYDGVVTLEDLKKDGDFGIGTFQNLDGEMILLDGVFYQVKADGVAYIPEDTVTSPFAAVTFFDTDREFTLTSGLTLTGLQSFLESRLPTENIFYAVKITGTFSFIETRSVPAQQKPYPPLVEVTALQSVFDFHDVTGTIVGFVSPPYVNGINVPGWHLHFLTDDKTAGGHILGLTVSQAVAAIDEISGFQLTLPGPDSGFYGLDLSGDSSGDLEQVEGK